MDFAKKGAAKVHLAREKLVEELKARNVHVEYNSGSFVACELSKRQILELSKNGLVSGIERWSPDTTVLACNEVGSRADIATLARSAYNPASAMPSDALGQGVNCATFEFGIHPDFVTQLETNGYDIGSVAGTCQ